QSSAPLFHLAPCGRERFVQSTNRCVAGSERRRGSLRPLPSVRPRRRGDRPISPGFAVQPKNASAAARASPATLEGTLARTGVRRLVTKAIRLPTHIYCARD